MLSTNQHLCVFKQPFSKTWYLSTFASGDFKSSINVTNGLSNIWKSDMWKHDCLTHEYSFTIICFYFAFFTCLSHNFSGNECLDHVGGMSQLLTLIFTSDFCIHVSLLSHCPWSWCTVAHGLSFIHQHLWPLQFFLAFFAKATNLAAVSSIGLKTHRVTCTFTFAILPCAPLMN